MQYWVQLFWIWPCFVIVDYWTACAGASRLRPELKSYIQVSRNRLIQSDWFGLGWGFWLWNFFVYFFDMVNWHLKAIDIEIPSCFLWIAWLRLGLIHFDHFHRCCLGRLQVVRDLLILTIPLASRNLLAGDLHGNHLWPNWRLHLSHYCCQDFSGDSSSKPNNGPEHFRHISSYLIHSCYHLAGLIGSILITLLYNWL